MCYWIIVVFVISFTILFFFVICTMGSYSIDEYEKKETKKDNEKEKKKGKI